MTGKHFERLILVLVVLSFLGVLGAFYYELAFVGVLAGATTRFHLAGTTTMALELSETERSLLVIFGVVCAVTSAKAFRACMPGCSGRRPPKPLRFSFLTIAMLLLVGLTLLNELMTLARWHQSLVLFGQVSRERLDDGFLRLVNAMRVSAVVGFGLLYSVMVIYFASRQERQSVVTGRSVLCAFFLVFIRPLVSAGGVLLPAVATALRFLEQIRPAFDDSQDPCARPIGWMTEFAERQLWMANGFLLSGLAVTVLIVWMWWTHARLDRQTREFSVQPEVSRIVSTGLVLIPSIVVLALLFRHVLRMRHESNLPLAPEYSWAVGNDESGSNHFPRIPLLEQRTGGLSVNRKIEFPDIRAGQGYISLTRSSQLGNGKDERRIDLGNLTDCPESWEAYVSADRDVRAAHLRHVLECACSPSLIVFPVEDRTEQLRPVLGKVFGYQLSQMLLALKRFDETVCVPGTQLRTMQDVALAVSELQGKYRRVVWAQDNSLLCSKN